ncbi:hypothetical protein [Alteriqipengyuania sp. 357]
MRLIPFLLASTLAACATPQEQAALGGSGGPAQAGAAAGATTQRVDLTGEWVIETLGGRPLEQPIALTGDTDALEWQPACAGQTISYRTSADGIAFARPQYDEPQIVCRIGYPQDLPRVLEALEGTWDVSRGKGGAAVLLTRGDERIVLSPLASDVPTTLAGEWRVAGIDGEPFDEPYGIALSADDQKIWWEPGCAGQSISYTIRDNRFAVTEPAYDGPVCKIGLPPRLPEIISAIRAADRIERTEENGIRLSGDGHSVTLFAQ